MENASCTKTYCNSKELSTAGKIALSTWVVIIGLASTIGNATVLWLIARNRWLRTISNLFLASLAAADFLVGLVIAPMWISIRIWLYWGIDVNFYVQTYGKAMDFLWIHTLVTTTFNLCCVTLDRHIAIFHPLRYQDIVTNKRCYVFIATVWFMSLVLPCSRFLVKDVSRLSTLWLSFAVIAILIPMIIVVFCSVRNLKAAAAQARRLNDNQGVNVVKRRQKNLKAAKTVGIVVGLFVVCWLASLITSFAHYFSKQIAYYSVYYTVWTSVETLAYFSSAINPWVYCLRNDDFYEALTRTFPFFKRRNSEPNCFHLNMIS